MTFYCVYIGVHITFLALHGAMGRRDIDKGVEHRKGMSYCPLIIFSIVFVIFLAIALTLFAVNTASIDYWSYYNNFLTLHSTTVVQALDGTLYLTGAFVQISKIINFSHKSHKASCWKHRCKITFGIIMASILLILNILSICLIFFFPDRETG